MADQQSSRANLEDPQDLRDQATRVWEHVLHADNDFVQRRNFFLVVESMLGVAFLELVPPARLGRRDSGYREVLRPVFVAELSS
jgi:hypothetical protein